MPRLCPVCSESHASSPADASRSTSAASSAPLPPGVITTAASATFSSPVLPPFSTGQRLGSFLPSVRLVVASLRSRVTRPFWASRRVCQLVAVPVSPNHALQRTAVLSVPVSGVGLGPTGSVTGCAAGHEAQAQPAPSPSTAVLTTPASGPPSLSLGSLGAATRLP